MAQSTTLPQTMQALLIEEVGGPLRTTAVPTPQAGPGAIVVRILAVFVDAAIPVILSGKVPGFTFPVPMVPGTRAVGRVAATGPDTTLFAQGQLVFVEPHLRARDDGDVKFIWGASDGVTAKSKALAAGCWRNGAMAEYALVPLENCWRLDETALCGQLGYTIADLVHLTLAAVPCGGLRAMSLEPGETVIIAPATGKFSGAAVGVAVAMGANVIAVGRNAEVLERLRAVHHPRVRTVRLTGTEEDIKAITDMGPVDAYLDMSPGAASKSFHFKGCIRALRPSGRIALMGLVKDDIPIPYSQAMWKNLSIKGQYMYEREDVRFLIRLAESGLLKLGEGGGHKLLGQFELERFEEAFKLAAKDQTAGKMVLLTP